ncbi:hypothetical protein [Marinobacter sp. S6332]|nr:hypothetical protein [Marinobacter sp. S6332]
MPAPTNTARLLQELEAYEHLMFEPMTQKDLVAAVNAVCFFSRC